MSWVNFFDDILVLNLLKRTDRLLQITEDFEKYSIPFKRVQSIESDNGAEGLKQTMVNIFSKAIEQQQQNLLIFEDDCEIVVGVDVFNDVMSRVVNQVPENYVMIFLGCQLTGGASHFVSPNIVAGKKMYSTHAVMYSLKGMKEILSHNLDHPIDNFYVDKIECYGNSYCTYPLLCSQRAGYSDIGKNEINWKPFIEPKFEQEINKMRARC